MKSFKKKYKIISSYFFMIKLFTCNFFLGGEGGL